MRAASGEPSVASRKETAPGSSSMELPSALYFSWDAYSKKKAIMACREGGGGGDRCAVHAGASCIFSPIVFSAYRVRGSKSDRGEVQAKYCA